MPVGALRPFGGGAEILRDVHVILEADAVRCFVHDAVSETLPFALAPFGEYLAIALGKRRDRFLPASERHLAADITADPVYPGLVDLRPDVVEHRPGDPVGV